MWIHCLDETLLKVGSEYTWLWVAIDAKSKEILSLLLLKNLRRETCLLRNGFCQTYSDTMESMYPVSTDGGTWYPMACQFLKLEHHLHSSYEKNLIERTMQYIKDRTESFDDWLLSLQAKELQTKTRKKLVEPVCRLSQQGIKTC